MALVVLLALAIDQLWGEPAARWHPVVWMGRSLQWMQTWVFALRPPELRPQAQTTAATPQIFWRGAFAWCLLALCFASLAWGLERCLQTLPWPLYTVLLALALKPMLAWRMLRQEVQHVELALQLSLVQGQQQLARLVSRDTTVLDATQVRESALESLAENLNDSVIAPLFWFALLGLPGAVLYRFANTADAMWGYIGQRGGRDWTWAGKWAARSDDVLSYIPARITALLLLVSAWLWHGFASSYAGRAMPVSSLAALRELRTQAAQTPSPNSGWPMACMAMLLDIRLSKPGVYVLHASGRKASAGDMAHAVRLASMAVLFGTLLASASLLLPSLPIRCCV